jgi:transcriptional regulator with XRE-family HTH domain
MTIGDRIREARLEAGLSQDDLSAKSGVTQANISKYERGEFIPQIPTLQKLAAALNKPISWFLNENHPQ